MLIEPVLAINMQFSFKPDVSQLELVKDKFEYNWWEEPCEPYVPYRKDVDGLDTEQLFRRLLDTMQQHNSEPFDPLK